tara:strand:- start:2030 stop:2284 length:255 start_codon:yes stop_codon:yes gene_type:complete
MSMIAKFIRSIREDHKAHLILGVLTGFPMVFFFGNIGGIVAISAYALKEILHDKILGKGNMEFLDWWWNSIPVFFYLIIYNFTI